MNFKRNMQMFSEIINFLSPEYCYLTEIPLSDSTIKFISKEKLNSLDYAGTPKEITLNLLKNYSDDHINISTANALLKVNENNSYLELLHLIKYQNKQYLGVEFGKLLGEKLKKDNMTDYDYICPVPVHHIRKRERGYNQAELIAQGVSQIINIIFIKNLLIRDKYNISQTTLSASERIKNVKKSFKFNKKYDIKNKTILLVDDILTTGSTLNNCALELLNAGAKKVDAATLALA